MASHCSHSQQQPTTTHTQPGHHLMHPFLTAASVHPSRPPHRYSDTSNACLLAGARHSASHRTGFCGIISPETSLPQRALPLICICSGPHLPHLLCLLHVTLSTSSSAEGSIQGHCSAGHHASVGHRGTPSLFAYLLDRHQT